MKMINGIEDIEKRYYEYNKLYFDGKLGKCTFHFFPKNSSNYGWYNGRASKDGTVINHIWIGTCIEWTDEKLKQILIHEMIHMYNRTIDNRKHLGLGLLGHGRLFRKQCRRLKRDYGIRIEKHPNWGYINHEMNPKTWERILLTLIDW